MAQFKGWAQWGYGSSHYYAIEYSGGGRDQYKHFVRACHQRGIAVIQDVVYNHYIDDGERAEWMYDSTWHDHNMYYYYHGTPYDYPGDKPTGHGGYCDNGSTGYLPNFAEEYVRRMMVGSAVALMTEFHVDGFRVDLTQALHRDNVLHANGKTVPEANASGIRFMKEWVRTLRQFRPSVVLVAEDHTGWSAMTEPQLIGGVGFDAVWWMQWYHHLIGDATNDASKVRLIHNAGLGDERSLHMDWMAGVLSGTPGHVVFHESHDEAGNSKYSEDGQERRSARTIMEAVGGNMNDSSRWWAEARARVAAGMTLLSAGTPLFFMGEEVGASKNYLFDKFMEAREDFNAMRHNGGAGLFRFYQDLIRQRRSSKALRSPEVEILCVHNDNRILAFRRFWGDEEFVVIASLSNHTYQDGYTIQHTTLAGKQWVELLNSDADIYHGSNLCNPGYTPSQDGRLNVRLGPASFSVLQRA